MKKMSYVINTALKTKDKKERCIEKKSRCVFFSIIFLVQSVDDII